MTVRSEHHRRRDHARDFRNVSRPLSMMSMMSMIFLLTRFVSLIRTYARSWECCRDDHAHDAHHASPIND